MCYYFIIHGLGIIGYKYERFDWEIKNIFELLRAKYGGLKRYLKFFIFKLFEKNM